MPGIKKLPLPNDYSGREQEFQKAGTYGVLLRILKEHTADDSIEKDELMRRI
jgi:hypothetical protein